jgi:uncharacterized protein
MNAKSFQQAVEYAAERLGSELAPHLSYHSLLHTRDEVVAGAERLARMEGLKGRTLELLLTAAWFHDLGYIEQAQYHELISARIARQVLPRFGYTAQQVRTVDQAIMATALPQSPADLLGQILADADLDVLGRTDFMQRNGDLRRELASLGKHFTDHEWYVRQIQFLDAHSYFTASAHALRDGQKAVNRAELEALLRELAPTPGT